MGACEAGVTTECNDSRGSVLNLKEIAHPSPTKAGDNPPSPDRRGLSPAGFLKPEDIQGMLGLSKWELQKLVQKKKIPHHRFGYRTVRFDPKKIKKWIEDREVRINPFALVKVRKATAG